MRAFACVRCLITVSYTHLDVYKRQVLGRIPRKTAGPESTVLINKDIGYDIEGGVCILRNFLTVHEFRVVSV